MGGHFPNSVFNTLIFQIEDNRHNRQIVLSAFYIFNSYQILRSNLILVLQKDDITFFVAFHVLTKEK